MTFLSTSFFIQCGLALLFNAWLYKTSIHAKNYTRLRSALLFLLFNVFMGFVFFTETFWNSTPLGTTLWIVCVFGIFPVSAMFLTKPAHARF